MSRMMLVWPESTGVFSTANRTPAGTAARSSFIEERNAPHRCGNAPPPDPGDPHPPRDRVGRGRVAVRKVGRHRPDLRKGEAVPGVEGQDRLGEIMEGEQGARGGKVQGSLPGG